MGVRGESWGGPGRGLWVDLGVLGKLFGGRAVLPPRLSRRPFQSKTTKNLTAGRNKLHRTRTNFRWKSSPKSTPTCSVRSENIRNRKPFSRFQLRFSISLNLNCSLVLACPKCWCSPCESCTSAASKGSLSGHVSDGVKIAYLTTSCSKLLLQNTSADTFQTG